jgi:hypothetical protein
MNNVEIRHAHFFCGLGGGAKGFNRARPVVGHQVGRFRCIGGIDVDPAGIRDFEQLSGVRGTVLDLFDREQFIAFHGREPGPGWREAGTADIHRAFGHERPHIVFLSAPCKGFSGLLSEGKSKTDKYQALNRLTLRGVWLMLEAFKDDPVEVSGVEKVASGLQQIQAELAGGVSVSLVPRVRTVVAAPAPRQREVTAAPAGSVEGLRAGAVRILQELAARAPAGYSRAQVGALTQFSPKGGTFNTYLGDLRRGAFIEERSGLVYATEHGIHSLGGNVPATPTTHDEVMRLWRKALRSGAFAMLEAVVAAGPAGIRRDDLAGQVDMTPSGGTFNTYLGDLRRNGLITERDKVCTANDILFPKEAGHGG